MKPVRHPDPCRRSSGRAGAWILLLGLLLGATSACSSLDEDGIGQTTTTTAAPTTTTTAPTTTAPTTTAPTTTAPTTTATVAPTTSVLGSTQLPDGALPRTGPSEAAVLAAIGCALLVAGRLALDGLGWLDRLHLARSGRPRPETPPR